VKDYATIANTLGSFPNVTGKDATGGGAVDGTPYIRQFIDDLWGFSQAMMNAAGLTPDGVTESASASQRLTAMRRIAGHPGEVVSWMGVAADPSSVGVRLLPLNGQGILRANYPELDSAVYVGDPNNATAVAFYHADDAAGTIRNTTGAYLILPDLRGLFLRGLDPSATYDPGGATREIGDVQSEDVMEHGHDQVSLSSGDIAPIYPNAYFNGVTVASSGGTRLDILVGQVFSSGTRISHDIKNVTTADGDQTAPYNSACRFCIRY
jgi:hypothetical protein